MPVVVETLEDGPRQVRLRAHLPNRSPSEVYRDWTEAEPIRAWWGPGAALDLRRGATYEFRWTKIDTVLRGKYTVLDSRSPSRFQLGVGRRTGTRETRRPSILKRWKVRNTSGCNARTVLPGCARRGTSAAALGRLEDPSPEAAGRTVTEDFGTRVMSPKRKGRSPGELDRLFLERANSGDVE
jgi:hypothetical protein